MKTTNNHRNKPVILCFGGIALVTNASISDAATIIPASGWTKDFVLGSGETYTSHEKPINTYIWFTTGLGITASTGGNGGLDPSGAVTIGSRDFQFQPFTGGTKNALVGDGTITIVTPAKFSELSVLGSRSGNGTAGTLTLNFADSSTATVALTTSSFPNWSGGISAILPNPRLTKTGTTAELNGAIGVLTLDLTNLDSTDYSGRTLNSITLSGVTTNSTTLFALNGVVVPEPASSCLVLLGLSGLVLVQRRR